MPKNIKQQTNWQTKKLGEVCNILDNKRKPITKRNRTTGEYPYYGATGILDYVGDYIFDEKLVLIGEDGAKWESGEHTAFIADGKYWVNNHAHVIRPHRNIILDNWIVFYFYLTDLTKHTTGLTVPKLNQANLKNIEIPLPPLPGQHRIVKILDEVFVDVAKVKENAEKNLQNAKEFFESYLQGIFLKPGKGWEEKRLGDIGKVSMCKRIFKEQTLTTGDIPFYKIGTFGKKPNAYISNKIYIEYRNKFSFPKKGDILLSASGTIGRRVKYDGEPAYFQDSNIVWIDNDEKQVLNDYLYYFYGACKWNSTKGATIARLYNDNLKQIKITFPKSTDEQKSIVAKLDALSVETRKLESIYQQKLVDLEELKKSVLKRAFNGEL